MNEFRYTKLDDLIGQSNVIDCLRISIKAAKQNNKPFPHCLFNGSAGVGKTSLALAIANELQVPITIASGAHLRSIKKILPYFTKTTFKSILFIDEIHRITKICDEFLYPVMEDFRIDLVENNNKVLSIDLEPFTLIAATTDAGTLSVPLHDRFPLKYYLRTYTIEELKKIIIKNGQKLKINLTDSVAEIIAQRSRETPRIANNLLLWIKDYTLVNKYPIVDDVVQKAFEKLGIDKYGLTYQDKKYLRVLKHFKGRPVGLDTIIANSNINVETILNQIEPFLLRKNIIMKTPKGRILKNG